MKRIQQSDGLITGRFHAVTYAIMCRVPFLAFESNTPKISYLVNDVGLNPSRVLHPESSVSIQEPLPFTEEEESNSTAYLAFSITAREQLKRAMVNLLNLH